MVQAFRCLLRSPAAAAIVTAALLVMAFPASAARDFGVLEEQLLREVNLARTDPESYRTYVNELRTRYRGDRLLLPGRIQIITKEGAAAVDEALSFLANAPPVPALHRSRGMSLAARDLVLEQGPAGTTGHESADGSRAWDRVSRYGTWRGLVAENIAYGDIDARMMVMSLIVDDGVADRGHRKNIYNGKFHVAGIACGPHKIFGAMCVIDFAASYEEGKK